MKPTTHHVRGWQTHWLRILTVLFSLTATAIVASAQEKAPAGLPPRSDSEPRATTSAPGIPRTSTTSTVTGAVLSVSDNELVELSVGIDDGVKEQTVFEVLRHDKLIGGVQVQSVTVNRSYGKVLPGFQDGPIRKGDHVVLSPKLTQAIQEAEPWNPQSDGSSSQPVALRGTASAEILINTAVYEVDTTKLEWWGPAASRWLQLNGFAPLPAKEGQTELGVQSAVRRVPLLFVVNGHDAKAAITKTLAPTVLTRSGVPVTVRSGFQVPFPEIKPLSSNQAVSVRDFGWQLNTTCILTPNGEFHLDVHFENARLAGGDAVKADDVRLSTTSSRGVRVAARLKPGERLLVANGIGDSRLLDVAEIVPSLVAADPSNSSENPTTSVLPDNLPQSVKPPAGLQSGIRPFIAATDSPESQRLLEHLRSQESAARAEAAAIRQLQAKGAAEANKQPIAEHKLTLKNLLNSALDLKLQLEELQIKELQSRLTGLQRQIGQRRALAEQIVERRAKELIEGDQLKWNASPYSTRPADGNHNSDSAAQGIRVSTPPSTHSSGPSGNGHVAASDPLRAGTFQAPMNAAAQLRLQVESGLADLKSGKGNITAVTRTCKEFTMYEKSADAWRYWQTLRELSDSLFKSGQIAGHERVFVQSEYERAKDHARKNAWFVVTEGQEAVGAPSRYQSGTRTGNQNAGQGSYPVDFQRGATVVGPASANSGTSGDNKEASKPYDSDIAALQGEWRVVSMSSDVSRENDVDGMKWSIANNVIKVVNVDGSTPYARFTLDVTRMPKAIDLTELDPDLRGKTHYGIYALDGSRLRICVASDGASEAERPTVFRVNPKGWIIELTKSRGQEVPDNRSPSAFDAPPPSSNASPGDTSSAVASYSMLDFIRDESFKQVKSLNSLEYTFETKDNDGWVANTEFHADNDRFYIKRVDSTGMTVLGKRLDPMTCASAFNGARQQYLDQQGRLRLKTGVAGAAYTNLTPHQALFMWLRAPQNRVNGESHVGGTDWRWDSIRNKELWDKRFAEATYIGAIPDDLSTLEIVDFPQHNEGQKPCVFRVLFARDFGFAPMKCIRRNAATTEISTEMWGEHYECIKKDGQEYWIPLTVFVSETGADRVSAVQQFSLTLSPESININEAVDASLFTIPQSQAKEVYDVDREDSRSDSRPAGGVTPSTVQSASESVSTEPAQKTLTGTERYARNTAAVDAVLNARRGPEEASRNRGPGRGVIINGLGLGIDFDNSKPGRTVRFTTGDIGRLRVDLQNTSEKTIWTGFEPTDACKAVLEISTSDGRVISSNACKLGGVTVIPAPLSANLRELKAHTSRVLNDDLVGTSKSHELRVKDFASFHIVDSDESSDTFPRKYRLPPGTYHVTAQLQVYRGSDRFELTSAALPFEVAASTPVSAVSGPSEPRWEVRLGAPILGKAAILDGRVYVGCMSGELVCLDELTGVRRWTYRSALDKAQNTYDPGFKASPTIGGDTIYVGDDEGIFHAVDRTTGERRWTFATGGEINGAAIVIDDKVLFGSYDHYVYCLDKANGALMWRFATEGFVHGGLALAGTNILVAGCDSHVRLIDLGSGTQTKDMKVESFITTTPAVQGDLVYIGMLTGDVLAANWKSGVTVWRDSSEKQGFPYLSSPVLADHLLIIGGGGYKQVRAFDRESGKLVWTCGTNGKVDGAPIVADTHVFVGSDDGFLYEVDRESGNVIAKYNTGSPITAAPSVADGIIVVGCDSKEGTVFCFAHSTRQSQ